MKYLICILGIIILPATAYCQDAIHTKGDKSLNFSFNGFAIENYKYGIGGTFWYSDDITLTGSLNGSNIDSDSAAESGINKTLSSSDSSSYGLSFGVAKHFNIFSVISPYIGSEASYRRSKTDRSSTSSPDEEMSTSTYSLNALLGVEYQLMKNISLAAEYSYGYFYSKSKNFTSASSFEATYKGFGLESSKLMLLFYF